MELRWGLKHCSWQREGPFAESPCSAPCLACARGVVERTPMGAPSCERTHPVAYWVALDPATSLLECHLERARWTEPARVLGGSSGWGGHPAGAPTLGDPG